MLKAVSNKVKLGRKLISIKAALKARHSEISFISSVDEGNKPSKYLLDLAPEFIALAKDINLGDVSNRVKQGTIKYTEIWPGEHYKLLAAVVKKLQPKLVLEIGTHLGMGTLTLKKFLPEDGKLYTYDIIEWNKFKDTLFVEADFDNRLQQVIGDIADAQVFEKNKNLLQEADLIFLDAPKDGIFELKFFELIAKMKFKPNAIMILDDIRVLNMVQLWSELKYPKLDITSFGHWSGTGIIELNAKGN